MCECLIQINPCINVNTFEVKCNNLIKKIKQKYYQISKEFIFILYSWTIKLLYRMSITVGLKERRSIINDWFTDHDCVISRKLMCWLWNQSWSCSCQRLCCSMLIHHNKPCRLQSKHIELRLICIAWANLVNQLTTVFVSLTALNIST